MEKLLAYRFSGFLPGHGRMHHGAPKKCTNISNAA